MSSMLRSGLLSLALVAAFASPSFAETAAVGTTAAPVVKAGEPAVVSTVSETVKKEETKAVVPAGSETGKIVKTEESKTTVKKHHGKHMKLDKKEEKKIETSVTPPTAQ